MNVRHAREILAENINGGRLEHPFSPQNSDSFEDKRCGAKLAKSIKILLSSPLTEVILIAGVLPARERRSRPARVGNCGRVPAFSCLGLPSGSIPIASRWRRTHGSPGRQRKPL